MTDQTQVPSVLSSTLFLFCSLPRNKHYDECGNFSVHVLKFFTLMYPEIIFIAFFVFYAQVLILELGFFIQHFKVCRMDTYLELIYFNFVYCSMPE